MKKLFGIAVLAGAILALPLFTQAADKAPETPPAKPEKKAKSVPFRGTIGAVDKVAKTVTLESKDKPRTFQVTSETKINKEKKPATLDAVMVGDHVGGAYRETAEGKMELVTLNDNGAGAPKTK
jgi:hypothetical protein